MLHLHMLSGPCCNSIHDLTHQQSISVVSGDGQAGKAGTLTVHAQGPWVATSLACKSPDMLVTYAVATCNMPVALCM